MRHLAARGLQIALATILVVFATEWSLAQEVKDKWIIGVWEGAHSHPTGIRSDSSRFEFSEDSGKIVWKMDRTSELSSFGRMAFEASGVVSKLSDSSVELEGKYDQSSAGAVVGRQLKYHLTRKGDLLEGYVLGSLTSFALSLKRAK